MKESSIKKLFALGLLFASLNIYSQSYLILSNGITLTTDKKGFIFDLGHFYLPFNVDKNSGSFFFEKDRLVTISEDGLLFEKELKVSKLKGKGSNYFISNNNVLVTIDSKGFIYKFDNDKTISRKAVAFGGRFFLVKEDKDLPGLELYTVNDKGSYLNIKMDELKSSKITLLGGFYFQTNDGTLFTISNEGFVFAKSKMNIGKIVKAGGNFFINADGLIFTISQEGYLLQANIPVNLIVSDIFKMGSNYMIDSTGKIFLVTKDGVIVERTIAHDLRNVKILSI
jgi:hypothetical protein